MIRFAQTFSTLPQTTLRRLRTTPAYFFLIWRWTTWLFALIWIMTNASTVSIAPLLLGITFIQSLAITLYVPFQTMFSGLSWLSLFRLRSQRTQQRRKRQRQMVSGHRNPQYPHLQASEQTEIHSDRRFNLYRDILVYGLDVVICGLVTYFSGPYWAPFFGDGSPFYRYGFSATFVAAFTYRYKGGLLAALGYDLFILLGAYFPPPGSPQPHLVPGVQDLIGSLVDVPLTAILAAYLATLLNSYIRSKRQEQDNVRQQKTLLAVGETLIIEANDKQRLLQSSAKQIRIGGHFERVILALVSPSATDPEEHGTAPELQAPPELELSVEAGLVAALSPDTSRTLLEHTARTGKKLLTFEMLYHENRAASYGIARLYMPFFTDNRVSLILAAESVRQTPFEEKQEKFMTIVGGQLVVALENMRLTEQTADLAATAERGRIAREMHDGVAQLIYMLSLHTETCAALSQRLESELPETRDQIKPLTESLDKLVQISKQALWETRHYMFTLKPLISGTTTISEMLTNQIREFEAISGLPVQLEIEGYEKTSSRDLHWQHQITQVGTAIFRITQEALSNAYKHAEATQISVHLYHHPRQIEVEIADNGKGLPKISNPDSNPQRIYSGHGIHGMRERASELGGELEITRSTQGGVRIHARIPI